MISPHSYAKLLMELAELTDADGARRQEEHFKIS